MSINQLFFIQALPGKPHEMKKLRKMGGNVRPNISDFFSPGLIHPVLLTSSAGGGSPEFIKGAVARPGQQSLMGEKPEIV